jgi:hypothetical protein
MFLKSKSLMLLTCSENRNNFVLKVCATVCIGFREGNRFHEELYLNFLYAPKVKSRRMGWAGHVARMGGEEDCV